MLDPVIGSLSLKTKDLGSSLPNRTGPDLTKYNVILRIQKQWLNEC